MHCRGYIYTAVCMYYMQYTLTAADMYYVWYLYTVVYMYYTRTPITGGQLPTFNPLGIGQLLELNCA